MSQSDPISPSHRAGMFQVPALLAAVLLVGANAFVLSPILTEVAAGLSTDPYRVAWAISTFGAATAVSSLGLAGFIDRLPAAHVLGAAALLMAIAQGLSALSQNWLWLCLAQALAGLATGVLLPGTYATAAATAPKGREAARLGFVLTGWALSLVFAVPLAALIAERFGWRMVYALLGLVSAGTALALALALAGVRAGSGAPSRPWRAARLDGVAPLLGVMFLFMTAFYGSFAFYGAGIRQAFDLSAEGAGIFMLGYGLGFGAAGIALGLVAPRITRAYLATVLVAIAATYLGWRLALTRPVAAFFLAAAWGLMNQLCLNGVVVTLTRRAPEARGAVMGLNSAVTYSAVFAGPMLMGTVFAASGFAGVGTLAAGLILVAALIVGLGGARGA